MSADRWVIVLAAGRTFIGQPCGAYVPETINLEPVYEMGTQLVSGPQGAAIVRSGSPVLLLGIKALAIPRAGAIVIEVATLSREEQGAVRKCVESAEAMANAIRASAAGVVLAGPGSKLPPLPRSQ